MAAFIRWRRTITTRTLPAAPVRQGFGGRLVRLRFRADIAPRGNVRAAVAGRSRAAVPGHCGDPPGPGRAGAPSQPGCSRLPCRHRALWERAGRMPGGPGPAFGGVSVSVQAFSIAAVSAVRGGWGGGGWGARLGAGASAWRRGFGGRGAVARGGSGGRVRGSAGPGAGGGRPRNRDVRAFPADIAPCGNVRAGCPRSRAPPSAGQAFRCRRSALLPFRPFGAGGAAAVGGRACGRAHPLGGGASAVAGRSRPAVPEGGCGALRGSAGPGAGGRAFAADIARCGNVRARRPRTQAVRAFGGVAGHCGAPRGPGSFGGGVCVGHGDIKAVWGGVRERTMVLPCGGLRGGANGRLWRGLRLSGRSGGGATALSRRRCGAWKRAGETPAHPGPAFGGVFIGSRHKAGSDRTRACPSVGCEVGRLAAAAPGRGR